MKNFRLLEAMDKAGYTQRRLAEMLGVHESFVSKLVNMRAIAREDEKQRIANILDSRVGELFP
jgi:transcriptional regulator with XRE-family HTH domain